MALSPAPNQLQSQKKADEIKEILNNIEDGIYELHPNAGGSSGVWTQFMLIKNSQTNQRVEFVQCTECKALLRFKDLSGTSHLLRHKCTFSKELETNARFRSLPLGKIEEAQGLIIQNIIKVCAEDFYSCEDLCDSPKFLDFLQSFVSFTHKYGNVDLKKIYPNGNLIRRNIVNTKEEKLREIYLKFRKAKNSDQCSSTIEIRKYTSSTGTDINLLIMSIQYFEDDLSALKKKIICTSVFDKKDTFESVQLNIIKNFGLFGGDQNDLEHLTIVTPTNEILSQALTNPFTRNDCVSCTITNILNEAFEKTSTVEINELLSNCRGIVRFITSNEQHNKMELSQDTGTWKTKVSMLRSIIDKYDEIVIILENEHQNQLRFSKRKAEELLAFLDPFVAAVDELSATTYTTANKILLWWAVLNEHFETQGDLSFEIKNIMINAKLSFDSRFRPRMANKIDCFLDPRYKYLIMLSEAERVEVVKEVRKLLEDINIADDISISPDVSARDADQPPKAKKSRFALYEASTSKTAAEKPKKDILKAKSRFAKYEVNNLQESDEVSKYTNLPPANPDTFESEFEMITKYWKPRKKTFPKLFKLVSSRLHIPACCGCGCNNTFTMKQILKPEQINELFIVKDNF